MENKKVLGKIIPALLVLVLALLLVITISSCSKGKKTPTGEIVDEKDYLKIDLANNKAYSVSKLEFYNKLRYVGYDVFEDALYEAALADIANDIKADIEANGANPESCKYYKKFKYVIDNKVYGTTDEDEIEKLKDNDKEIKEKTYLNELKQNGYEINYEKGIYQKASLESMLITLAKREYARQALLEEIDEDDSEYQITFKKIESFFEEKVVDKDDLAALLILCSSQTEINDTLKQLNLKFVGNRLYRVLPTDDIYDDPTQPKFSEYEEFYDDFDSAADGVSALDDNEVLFELCRLYNYVYSYKAQLKYVINGEDYLAKYSLDTFHRTYTDADYQAIKNFTLDDAIAMVLAQDTGEDDVPRLFYTKQQLSKIDGTYNTLQSELNRNYLVHSKEHSIHNTPSSTYGRGNYLAFKLKDGFILDYRGVEALANLQNAIDNNESESVIKGHIESIWEEFEDIINGYGYTTDEEIKAWALDYATKITAFGITGAKEIVASTKDKENPDSIFNKIFETLLTDEYINEKLNEFLKDNCKISIYDNLFEVQFAQNNEFYKAGNKTSKKDVLKVKVTNKDTKETKETVITAVDMFDRLYKRHGAIEATYTLGTQVLKDLYYDEIFLDEKGKTTKKYKEYEEQYDQILTYFASGNSSQYGYSPSIGQKAFVNLYFRADNKDDAIFNMWVSTELQNTLLYQNPNEIRSDMLTVFDTLTNISYNNYAHIEYSLLYVYTDDDEDGEADDWTKVDDTDPRKQEVMQLSVKLINLINNRAEKEFSNSNRSSAYNNLISNYESASRISQIGNYADGDTEPASFDTSTEKEAYYFARFKEKGLLLSEDAEVAIHNSQEVIDLDDDAYEAQIKEIYNYIIRNYKDALDDDQIIARKVVTDDSGDNITKVSADTLFEFKKGYGSFYIIKTTEAESFKFEEKDNADTSTGSKVYPYSVDETNPFPVNADGKPEVDEANTLYNSNDTVSKNQLIVYVREYKDGVESLSLSVVDAFKSYFENQFMANYTSESFRYYILKLMIDKYKAEGKVAISDDLMSLVNTFVEAKNESLFGFKTSEISTAWYDTFK